MSFKKLQLIINTNGPMFTLKLKFIKCIKILQFENRNPQRADCVYQLNLCPGIVFVRKSFKNNFYAFGVCQDNNNLMYLEVRSYSRRGVSRLITDCFCVFIVSCLLLRFVSIHSSLDLKYLKLYFAVHCALLCLTDSKLLTSTCQTNNCYCDLFRLTLFLFNTIIVKLRNGCT